MPPINPYDPEDGSWERPLGRRPGVYPYLAHSDDAWTQAPKYAAAARWDDYVLWRPVKLPQGLRHAIYEVVLAEEKAVSLGGVPVVFRFGDRVSSATHDMRRIIMAGIPLRGVREWMPG